MRAVKWLNKRRPDVRLLGDNVALLWW